MRRAATILLLFCVTTAIAQVNKGRTNWLTEKKEHTARWRVGLGVDVFEPMGFDLQFYRLSQICTGDFSITKKIAVGIWAGREGVVLGELIKKQNGDGWTLGGLRYGIDLKLYLPVPLNPYFGFGAEGGTRKQNGSSGFYPDAVLRLGVEQKVAGIKLSTRSSLNITLFADGKYSYCITEKFSYIVPSIGIRLHFL